MNSEKKGCPMTSELIDFSHTLAGEMLSKCEYPWEALPKIKECIIYLIEKFNL